MSPTQEAAMRMALEALHEIGWSNNTRWQSDRAATVIPALRGALAEPVQEPEGYFSVNDYGRWEENESGYGTPLYASPQPQQTEPSQDTPPQHEYEVTANDDGTFSVGLPDGEELRIIPPQRPAEPTV